MRRMCVVALAHRVHPDWPLILIGNRDEFHARAAAPLHEWADGSGIVAGRDLQAGATWLGVQRPGELGRASCRESRGQYVYVSVGDVSLQKTIRCNLIN